MAKISPLALVDPAADLADDVVVGPFSYIGPQVRIAAGCRIANNVTIEGRTSLAENTRVAPLAVIGTSRDGSPGAVEIGPDNDIREQVTIYAGPPDGPETHLGRGNLLMVAVQVGPGAVLGDHGIYANCVLIESGAAIEEYIRASAFSVVEASVRVGAYSFVAGYAVVDHNAPPYAMLQGNPYRVRGVNTHNLTRCGFRDEEIQQLKSAFRELFDPSESYPDRKVLERLMRQGDLPPHVQRLVKAIDPGDPREGPR